jgi:hypothetical protein
MKKIWGQKTLSLKPTSYNFDRLNKRRLILMLKHKIEMMKNLISDIEKSIKW